MTKTIKKLGGEQVTANHVQNLEKTADSQVDLFRLTNGELVVCRTKAGEAMPQVDANHSAADYGLDKK